MATEAEVPESVSATTEGEDGYLTTGKFDITVNQFSPVQLKKSEGEEDQHPEPVKGFVEGEIAHVESKSGISECGNPLETLSDSKVDKQEEDARRKGETLDIGEASVVKEEDSEGFSAVEHSKTNSTDHEGESETNLYKNIQPVTDELARPKLNSEKDEAATSRESTKTITTAGDERQVVEQSCEEEGTVEEANTSYGTIEDETPDEQNLPVASILMRIVKEPEIAEVGDSTISEPNENVERSEEVLNVSTVKGDEGDQGDGTNATKDDKDVDTFTTKVAEDDEYTSAVTIKETSAKVTPNDDESSAQTLQKCDSGEELQHLRDVLPEETKTETSRENAEESTCTKEETTIQHTQESLDEERKEAAENTRNLEDDNAREEVLETSGTKQETREHLVGEIDTESPQDFVDKETNEESSTEHQACVEAADLSTITEEKNLEEQAIPELSSPLVVEETDVEIPKEEETGVLILKEEKEEEDAECNEPAEVASMTHETQSETTEDTTEPNKDLRAPVSEESNKTFVENISTLGEVSETGTEKYIQEKDGLAVSYSDSASGEVSHVTGLKEAETEKEERTENIDTAPEEKGQATILKDERASDIEDIGAQAEENCESKEKLEEHIPTAADEGEAFSKEAEAEIEEQVNDSDVAAEEKVLGTILTNEKSFDVEDTCVQAEKNVESNENLEETIPTAADEGETSLQEAEAESKDEIESDIAHADTVGHGDEIDNSEENLDKQIPAGERETSLKTVEAEYKEQGKHADTVPEKKGLATILTDETPLDVEDIEVKTEDSVKSKESVEEQILITADEGKKSTYVSPEDIEVHADENFVTLENLENPILTTSGERETGLGETEAENKEQVKSIDIVPEEIATISTAATPSDVEVIGVQAEESLKSKDKVEEQIPTAADEGGKFLKEAKAENKEQIDEENLNSQESSDKGKQEVLETTNTLEKKEEQAIPELSSPLVVEETAKEIPKEEEAGVLILKEEKKEEDTECNEPAEVASMTHETQSETTEDITEPNKDLNAPISEESNKTFVENISTLAEVSETETEKNMQEKDGLAVSNSVSASGEVIHVTGLKEAETEKEEQKENIDTAPEEKGQATILKDEMASEVEDIGVQAEENCESKEKLEEHIPTAADKVETYSKETEAENEEQKNNSDVAAEEKVSETILTNERTFNVEDTNVQAEKNVESNENLEETIPTAADEGETSLQEAEAESKDEIKRTDIAHEDTDGHGDEIDNSEENLHKQIPAGERETSLKAAEAEYKEQGKHADFVPEEKGLATILTDETPLDVEDIEVKTEDYVESKENVEEQIPTTADEGEKSTYISPEDIEVQVDENFITLENLENPVPTTSGERETGLGEVEAEIKEQVKSIDIGPEEIATISTAETPLDVEDIGIQAEESLKSKENVEEQIPTAADEGEKFLKEAEAENKEQIDEETLNSQESSDKEKEEVTEITNTKEDTEREEVLETTSTEQETGEHVVHEIHTVPEPPRDSIDKETNEDNPGEYQECTEAADLSTSAEEKNLEEHAIRELSSPLVVEEATKEIPKEEETYTTLLEEEEKEGHTTCNEPNEEYEAEIEKNIREKDGNTVSNSESLSGELSHVTALKESGIEIERQDRNIDTAPEEKGQATISADEKASEVEDIDVQLKENLESEENLEEQFPTAADEGEIISKEAEAENQEQIKNVDIANEDVDAQAEKTVNSEENIDKQIPPIAHEVETSLKETAVLIPKEEKKEEDAECNEPAEVVSMTHETQSETTEDITEPNKDLNAPISGESNKSFVENISTLAEVSETETKENIQEKDGLVVSYSDSASGEVSHVIGMKEAETEKEEQKENIDTAPEEKGQAEESCESKENLEEHIATAADKVETFSKEAEAENEEQINNNDVAAEEKVLETILTNEKSFNVEDSNVQAEKNVESSENLEETIPTAADEGETSLQEAEAEGKDEIKITDISHADTDGHSDEIDNFEENVDKQIPAGERETSLKAAEAEYKEQGKHADIVPEEKGLATILTDETPLDVEDIEVKTEDCVESKENVEEQIPTTADEGEKSTYISPEDIEVQADENFITPENLEKPILTTSGERETGLGEAEAEIKEQVKSNDIVPEEMATISTAETPSDVEVIGVQAEESLKSKEKVEEQIPTAADEGEKFLKEAEAENKEQIDEETLNSQESSDKVEEVTEITNTKDDTEREEVLETTSTAADNVETFSKEAEAENEEQINNSDVAAEEKVLETILTNEKSFDVEDTNVQAEKNVESNENLEETIPTAADEGETSLQEAEAKSKDEIRSTDIAHADIDGHGDEIDNSEENLDKQIPAGERETSLKEAEAEYKEQVKHADIVPEEKGLATILTDDVEDIEVKNDDSVKSKEKVEEQIPTTADEGEKSTYISPEDIEVQADENFITLENLEKPILTTSGERETGLGEAEAEIKEQVKSIDIVPEEMATIATAETPLDVEDIGVQAEESLNSKENVEEHIPTAADEGEIFLKEANAENKEQIEEENLNSQEQVTEITNTIEDDTEREEVLETTSMEQETGEHVVHEIHTVPEPPRDSIDKETNKDNSAEYQACTEAADLSTSAEEKNLEEHAIRDFSSPLVVEEATDEIPKEEETYTTLLEEEEKEGHATCNKPSEEYEAEIEKNIQEKDGNTVSNSESLSGELSHVTALKESETDIERQDKNIDTAPEEKGQATISADETALEVEDIDVQLKENLESEENLEEQFPIAADEGEIISKEAEAENKEQIKNVDIAHEDVDAQAEKTVNSEENIDKQIPPIAHEGETSLKEAEVEDKEQVTYADIAPEEKGLATILTDETPLEAEDIGVKAEESFESKEKSEEKNPIAAEDETFLKEAKAENKEQIECSDIAPEDKGLATILTDEKASNIEDIGLQAEETFNSNENLAENFPTTADEGKTSLQEDTCVQAEKDVESNENLEENFPTTADEGETSLQEDTCVQAEKNVESNENLEENFPTTADEGETSLQEAEAESKDEIKSTDIADADTDGQGDEIDSSEENLDKQIPADERETSLKVAEGEYKEQGKHADVVPEEKGVATILTDETPLDIEDIEVKTEDCVESKENLEEQIPTTADEGEKSTYISPGDIEIQADEIFITQENLEEPILTTSGERETGLGETEAGIKEQVKSIDIVPEEMATISTAETPLDVEVIGVQAEETLKSKENMEEQIPTAADEGGKFLKEAKAENKEQIDEENLNSQESSDKGKQEVTETTNTLEDDTTREEVLETTSTEQETREHLVHEIHTVVEPPRDSIDKETNEDNSAGYQAFTEATDLSTTAEEKNLEEYDIQELSSPLVVEEETNEIPKEEETYATLLEEEEKEGHAKCNEPTEKYEAEIEKNIQEKDGNTVSNSESLSGELSHVTALQESETEIGRQDKNIDTAAEEKGQATILADETASEVEDIDVQLKENLESEENLEEQFPIAADEGEIISKEAEAENQEQIKNFDIVLEDVDAQAEKTVNSEENIDKQILPIAHEGETSLKEAEAEDKEQVTHADIAPEEKGLATILTDETPLEAEDIGVKAEESFESKEKSEEKNPIAADEDETFLKEAEAENKEQIECSDIAPEDKGLATILTDEKASNIEDIGLQAEETFNSSKNLESKISSTADEHETSLKEAEAINTEQFKYTDIVPEEKGLANIVMDETSLDVEDIDVKSDEVSESKENVEEQIPTVSHEHGTFLNEAEAESKEHIYNTDISPEEKGLATTSTDEATLDVEDIGVQAERSFESKEDFEEKIPTEDETFSKEAEAETKEHIKCSDIAPEENGLANILTDKTSLDVKDIEVKAEESFESNENLEKQIPTAEGEGETRLREAEAESDEQVENDIAPEERVLETISKDEMASDIDDACVQLQAEESSDTKEFLDEQNPTVADEGEEKIAHGNIVLNDTPEVQILEEAEPKVGVEEESCKSEAQPEKTSTTVEEVFDESKITGRDFNKEEIAEGNVACFTQESIEEDTANKSQEIEIENKNLKEEGSCIESLKEGNEGNGDDLSPDYIREDDSETLKDDQKDTVKSGGEILKESQADGVDESITCETTVIAERSEEIVTSPVTYEEGEQGESSSPVSKEEGSNEDTFSTKVTEEGDSDNGAVTVTETSAVVNGEEGLPQAVQKYEPVEGHEKLLDVMPEESKTESSSENAEVVTCTKEEIKIQNIQESLDEEKKEEETTPVNDTKENETEVEEVSEIASTEQETGEHAMREIHTVEDNTQEFNDKETTEENLNEYQVSSEAADSSTDIVGKNSDEQAGRELSSSLVVEDTSTESSKQEENYVLSLKEEENEGNVECKEPVEVANTAHETKFETLEDSIEPKEDLYAPTSEEETHTDLKGAEAETKEQVKDIEIDHEEKGLATIETENKISKEEGSCIESLKDGTGDDLSPEYIREDESETFTDDGKDAVKSGGEILKESQADGVDESITCETTVIAERSEEIVTSPVTYEEGEQGESSSPVSREEASNEDTLSTKVAEEGDGDSGAVTVIESSADVNGEEGLPQAVQKYEPVEGHEKLLDLMPQESKTESASENAEVVTCTEEEIKIQNIQESLDEEKKEEETTPVNDTKENETEVEEVSEIASTEQETGEHATREIHTVEDNAQEFNDKETTEENLNEYQVSSEAADSGTDIVGKNSDEQASRELSSSLVGEDTSIESSKQEENYVLSPKEEENEANVECKEPVEVANTAHETKFETLEDNIEPKEDLYAPTSEEKTDTDLKGAEAETKEQVKDIEIDHEEKGLATILTDGAALENVDSEEFSENQIPTVADEGECNTELAGDKAAEESFQVQNLEEAEPKLRVEDERRESEDHSENNMIVEEPQLLEQVLDEPKSTDGDFGEGQTTEGNAAICAPDIIQEETAKNSQDTDKETENLQEEILKEPEIARVGESTTCETNQIAETSEEIFDASPVKCEEGQPGEGSSQDSAKASKEDVTEDDGNNGAVTVTESSAEVTSKREEDSAQPLEKFEPEEEKVPVKISDVADAKEVCDVEDKASFAEKTTEETSLQREGHAEVSELAPEKLDVEATEEEFKESSEIVPESDSRSIDVVSKDEIVTSQTLDEGISQEQFEIPSSTLLTEAKEIEASQQKHETPTKDENIEEEHEKEMPADERARDLSAERSEDETPLQREESKELKASELALEKLDAGDTEEGIKETLKTISKSDSQSTDAVLKDEIVADQTHLEASYASLPKEEELKTYQDDHETTTQEKIVEEEYAKKTEVPADENGRDLVAATLAEETLLKEEPGELKVSELAPENLDASETKEEIKISSEKVSKSDSQSAEVVSGDETTAYQTELAGDKALEESFQVQTLEEAEPILRVEDESRESEDHPENNNIVEEPQLLEQVLDEPKSTDGDSSEGQTTKRNAAICTPEIIEEGAAKNSQDSDKETANSQEEILKEPETAGVGESTTYETNQIAETSEEIFDASPVKYEEGQPGEGSSQDSAKASKEEDVTEDDDNNGEVTVTESNAEVTSKWEEDSAQPLEKYEPEEEKVPVKISDVADAKEVCDVEDKSSFAEKTTEETSLQREGHAEASELAPEKPDVEATEEEFKEGSEIVPESDSRSIDVVSKDEIATSQTLDEGISQEQVEIPSSTLLTEAKEIEASQHEHETPTKDKNIEEEHEQEMPADENAGDLSAVRSEDETPLPKEESEELKHSELALEKLDAGDTEEEIKETFKTISKSDSQSTDAVLKDEIVADQTHLEASYTSLPKEEELKTYQEDRETTTQDKGVEEEYAKETEAPADENGRDLVAPTLAEETLLQKEEPEELKVSELAPENLDAGETEEEIKEAFEKVSKSDSQSSELVSGDETTAYQTLHEGISNEQLQLPSSTLVPEEKEIKISQREHETTTQDKNKEGGSTEKNEVPSDENTRDLFVAATSEEETCLQKEEPREFKACELAPEKRDAGETEEIKETLETISQSDSQSIDTVSKDDIVADQTLVGASYTSLPKEKEHEAGENEAPADENGGDLISARSVEETILRKEEHGELKVSELAPEELNAGETEEEIKKTPEGVSKPESPSTDVVTRDEAISEQTLHEGISSEKLQIPSSVLLPEEKEIKASEEHGTTFSDKNIEDNSSNLQMQDDENTKATSTAKETSLTKEEPRELKASDFELHLTQEVPRQSSNEETTEDEKLPEESEPDSVREESHHENKAEAEKQGEQTDETSTIRTNEHQNELSEVDEKGIPSEKYERQLTFEDLSIKEHVPRFIEDKTIQEGFPEEEKRVEEAAFEFDLKNQGDEMNSKSSITEETQIEKDSKNSPIVETSHEVEAKDTKSTNDTCVAPEIKERIQVGTRSPEEKEATTTSKEQQIEEDEEEEHESSEEVKADEEKGEKEHKNGEPGYDSPIMVEASRDPDVHVKAVSHKKSSNILSGIKHSISKVKKAITGKSSHSKTKSEK